MVLSLHDANVISAQVYHLHFSCYFARCEKNREDSMKPTINHRANELNNALIYSQASFQAEDKKNLFRLQGKFAIAGNNIFHVFHHDSVRRSRGNSKNLP